MERHSLPDDEAPNSIRGRRPRRRNVLIATALVLSLAAGTGIAAGSGLLSFGDDCAGSAVRIDLAASPDIAPAVRAVAENARRNDVTSDGRCIDVQVEARENHEIADDLATGTAAPEYEVWLPDSDVWVERALDAEDGITLTPAGNAASTPVALAVIPSMRHEARLAREDVHLGRVDGDDHGRRPDTARRGRSGAQRHRTARVQQRRRLHPGGRPRRRRPDRRDRRDAGHARVRLGRPGRGLPGTRPDRQRRGESGALPHRTGRVHPQLRRRRVRSPALLPDGRRAGPGLSVEPHRRGRTDHGREPGRDAVHLPPQREGGPAHHGGARVPYGPLLGRARPGPRRRWPRPAAVRPDEGAAADHGHGQGVARHVDGHRAERPADRRRRHLGLDGGARAGSGRRVTDGRHEGVDAPDSQGVRSRRTRSACGTTRPVSTARRTSASWPRRRPSASAPRTAPRTAKASRTPCPNSRP